MSASHPLPSHAAGKQSRGRGAAIVIYMLFLGSVLAVINSVRVWGTRTMLG